MGMVSGKITTMFQQQANHCEKKCGGAGLKGLAIQGGCTMCNRGKDRKGSSSSRSSSGRERKGAQGGDPLLGSSSHPGRLHACKAQEQERNGVGAMGRTGALGKTGGGNNVTGFQRLGTLFSSNSNIVIWRQHPGTLYSRSNTSTACQAVASSRVPPTQPNQLNIGRSYLITTTVC